MNTKKQRESKGRTKEEVRLKKREDDRRIRLRENKEDVERKHQRLCCKVKSNECIDE